MLNTTKNLIAYLKQPRDQRSGLVVSAWVNAIITCGTTDDADALLPLFLNNPSDFDHSYLLTVIKYLGTSTHAKELYHRCINQHRLAEGMPEEILEVLGRLQFLPARPMLIQYALGTDGGTSYSHSQYAVLGLLHMDCSGYESQIAEAIRKCYGQNLFPEFVPALVCKLPDRNDYLAPLYELGNEQASTDCNAGIILGISLCGEPGKKYFKQILFNPNWETFSGGTGTAHATYQALKNLGITFQEMYTDIKAGKTCEQPGDALKVLFALIGERLTDYKGGHTESFIDLYHLFFKWKNGYESDNLVDLAGKFNLADSAYELEQALIMKITEEAIVNNIRDMAATGKVKR
jgi:hypothetical protein